MVRFLFLFPFRFLNFESPSSLSNIFFSESTGPIEVRFDMEQLCFAGTKVSMTGPGHMNKKAAMLIYGENTSIRILY